MWFLSKDLAERERQKAERHSFACWIAAIVVAAASGLVIYRLLWSGDPAALTARWGATFAAAMAFLVVALCRLVEGSTALDLFGQKFKGGGAAACLWAMAFVIVVGALWLLR